MKIIGINAQFDVNVNVNVWERACVHLKGKWNQGVKTFTQANTSAQQSRDVGTQKMKKKQKT